MGNWQKVYFNTLEYRAEIVRAVLEDHGLQPVLVNKKDSTYHLGQFEVHVAPENVIKSLIIIKDDIKFS